MTFDGTTFRKADRTPLPVVATRKRGRWQYRTEGGRLLASGMTPEQFVAEFWHTTVEVALP